nr:nitroreductase family protein [Pseudonocardia acidicola]
MRHLGYRPGITLLPDGRQPWHVATVRAVGLEAPTRATEERYAAVAHRHCHRGPYTRRPVAAQTLRRLLAVGARPGVHVRRIDRPGRLAALAEVLADGASRLAADEEARAELARWVRTPGAAEHDGVPRRTPAGPGQPLPGLFADPMPVAEPGELTAALSGRVLIVVGTDQDTRTDAVQTGRSTQDVLLTATAAGLAGSVIGTVLDVPGLRERLRVRLGLTGTPQLLIRLGWASGRAAGSPRRAPDAFVIDPLRDS